MQAPICEVCLKSDILCSACQEKLNRGEANKTEIDVSRFLYKLSEKMRSLKDVKILKVIDCGVLLIISGRGDAAKIVGREGAIVKKIAKEFRKSIRILEEAPSFKDFVEELISPTPINGINTLYKENEEIYRIRISNLQKGHLMISPEIFSKIISNFYNVKAELVFEG
jgi:transcription antitermination factor NusA-like protein